MCDQESKDTWKPYVGAFTLSEPIPIYPPGAERYLIAATFAKRVLVGKCSEQEIEFMNKFLSIEADFNTWFPDPEFYKTAIDALFASDERKTVA